MLDVIEKDGPGGVRVKNSRVLEMHVRPGSDSARRTALLQSWYRERLRELATGLIAKWEKRLGVSLAECGIKRMKTKWGSCNPKARRIWLNSELAKKPPECLEYIVVHELVHLKEKTHDERFVRMMDRELPRWRQVKQVLNATPLGSESWRE